VNKLIPVSVLALSLAFSGGAAAQTRAGNEKSSTFRVSANVQATCDVRASDLNFGQYNAQSANALYATSQVTVMCTPQTTFAVGLNAGTSPGATVNQRKMVNGANTLNYQLFQDPARQRIWGTTAGTDTVTGVGTGLDQDLTVFGAVPAAQLVPAGAFSDTITVRVFY
jgi:spore coat protein U-like protein